MLPEVLDPEVVHDFAQIGIGLESKLSGERFCGTTLLRPLDLLSGGKNI